MRSSSALLIRSLISKLHPPAPITPRESQQLLRALNGAFRKQLDEAHPAPSSYHESDQSVGPAHGRRSASSHVDSLLKHPMLVSKADTSSTRGIRAVDLLDFCLRTGSLTPAAIGECTRKHMGEWESNPSDKSPMTTRLAAWFDSANPHQRADFFNDSAALRSTLRVVTVEKAEEMTWTWLKVLYESEWRSTSLNRSRQLYAEDLLVSELMNFSFSNSHPGAAVQQFIAANRYRAERISTAADSGLDDSMVVSWHRLARFILRSRSRHGIDETTYNSILQYAPPLGTKSVIFTSGFLELYHPTSATASTLHNDLQATGVLNMWLRFKDGQRQREYGPNMLTFRLLTVILDAAELSLKQKRRQEAIFFLGLAEQHFSDLVSGTDEDVAPVVRLQQARQAVQQSLCGLQFQMINTSWTTHAIPAG